METKKNLEEYEMTLTELKKYPALAADIKRCREKIKEIDADMVYPKSLSLSTNGILSSANHKSTEYGYIENITKKEKYEKRIEEDKQQIQRIERYISGIADLRTKMIFEMRVYDQQSWRKIATAFGGKNSSESVQKIYRRYVEKHPNG